MPRGVVKGRRMDDDAEERMRNTGSLPRQALDSPLGDLGSVLTVGWELGFIHPWMGGEAP